MQFHDGERCQNCYGITLTRDVEWPAARNVLGINEISSSSVLED